ncbi:hypothetical protein CJF32_00010031 [Rutstroemia sp. NJR-2017a WRK4]|nr:hypothetical protein CJF32_00010031 [Rutstroemia sp. NJR-2017a WRK4]
MDPLSIASIVVKLTATCLSTAKTLSAIQSDYKDAPISIVSICSEAAVISACLSRLQMIVCEKQDLVQTLESRTELNYALDVALTGCVVLFSCLDDEIRNITSDSSLTTAGAIKWKGKAKLVWNHEKLRDLLDGLRGQQVAVNLLIQLVQLESIGEIKQALGHKGHVLTASIRRTQSLKQSHSSMSFPTSIYSMDDRQSVSANAPSISGASGVNFEFDDLIVNSRVYRQVLASARSKLAEPDGKVDRSSVDFPDSPTIMSLQTKNVTQDLEFWDISKHEQEPDTVSGSITPRPAVENNYLMEHEGQGNVKLDEARITRNPIARLEVIQATSANASDYFLPYSQDGETTIHYCVRCDVELRYNVTKPQVVAVKFIKHDLSFGCCKEDISSQIVSAYGEIAILHKLDHPNIISLVEVLESSINIGLVFSYFQHRDLSLYIKARSYVPELSAKRFFGQIISGVEYMHKGGIIHRNLCPENLLLDDDLNIPSMYIDPPIDLEVKKTYFDYNPGFKHSVRGADLSLLNLAEKQRTGFTPEVFHGCVVDVPSQAVVWSCGAILYEILVGHLQFASSSELAYILDKNPSLSNVAAPNKRLLFPKHISIDARNLLRSILKFDPLVRADLDQVKGHRWMCNYSELTTSVRPPPGRL